MTINDNDSSLRAFSEIQSGECFCTEHLTTIYYMKINGVEKVENAVNLRTGTCAYFFPNDKVKPVNIVGRIQDDSNT